MAFTAICTKTGQRLVLPGATEAEKQAPGARVLTTSPRGREVTCPDPHCEDIKLIYRQGPFTQAHWAHPPGRGESCSYEGEGGAGGWHRRVQLDILAGAIGHEVTMDGARADVILATSSRDTEKRIAVEVQHSPITRFFLRARHTAHQAAGLQGTIWIVDGDAISKHTRAPAWWGDARETQGKPARISRTWVVDLVREAQRSTHKGYPVNVMLLRDGHARLIDRAEITTRGSKIVARVTEWSRAYTEDALREWAHGPTGHPVQDGVLSLRQAHTRAIKAPLTDRWTRAA